MARKKRVYENILIDGYDSKGQPVSAEVEGGKRLRFDARFAAKGDLLDAESMRKKGDYVDSRVLDIRRPSPDRATPWCPHYGVCGGCSWQHIGYPSQIQAKTDILSGIIKKAGVEIEPDGPVLESPLTTAYRNKLEYSFSRRRWFLEGEESEDRLGLGFFVPRQNNRVVDIHSCYHQGELSNLIRNRVREVARDRRISFHDPIVHDGLLRTLVVRITGTGEAMIALVVYEEAVSEFAPILDMIRDEFPQVKSLYYIVNAKMNDAYGDCPATLYHGEAAVYEKLGNLRFRIGPLSFFQVNPLQTVRLYDLVREYAGLDGSQSLYDLYTGTGSIAMYLADAASKVVGIEYVEAAVADARLNAELNGVENCSFFAGDMKDILVDDFFAQHGTPDVMVCDPPRAGMHPDVVETIIRSGVKTIVYVSCNPLSLARDLEELTKHYRVLRYRGVDMSPQTPHIETVMLLERR